MEIDVGPAALTWSHLQEHWDRAGAWRACSDRERAWLETRTDARVDEFLLGRTLAHALLERARFPHARVTAHCERCGGPHGQPRVVGAQARVSIAHAGGLVVAALAPADTVTLLGVDTEADVPASRIDRRAWTRYEATRKALGHGLGRDLGPEGGVEDRPDGPALDHTDTSALERATSHLLATHGIELHDVAVPGHVTTLALALAPA